MKKKHITNRNLRYLALVLTTFLFSGYGNKYSHPYLNEMIVQVFAKRYVMFDYNEQCFKNYKFNFTRNSLPGDSISESGMFHANDYSQFNAEQKSYVDMYLQKVTLRAKTLASVYTEKSGSMSTLRWIKHGGFSADVPEVHASLRHFYDPTQNENKRYLSDKVNNPVVHF